MAYVRLFALEQSQLTVRTKPKQPEASDNLMIYIKGGTEDACRLIALNLREEFFKGWDSEGIHKTFR